MGFYDSIAKDIPWEIGVNTDGYLKVVNGKLQLPNPKWLQYHLRYLDNVIEAIHAFRAGKLRTKLYDLDLIEKKVIDNPEEAKRFLREVLSKYKKFSIDIESDNLSTCKKQNKVLCIGLAYEATKGVSFLAPCFEDQEFRDMFQHLVNNAEQKMILHNSVFDRSRTMIIEGIEIKIDGDTMLKHYVGINEHKGTHGLKKLAQLYLGFPDWEKDLDDWKREYCRRNKIKLGDFQYSYFDQEWLAEYNVIDCCATFQLDEMFEELMRPETKEIYKSLIRAAEYYADMISRGMLLNEEYWYELRDKLEAEKEELEKQMDEFAPGVLMTSPKQVHAWLTKKFPYDIIESTNKETIEKLQDKYPEDKELQTLLDYRKNSKYLKTYVYGLWNRKDYENTIHCEFKLHGTETGRLSSANPNMQNIPRNALVKRLFVARPGYTLLQLDYSQAELRVMAHITGDEKLTKVYQDGRDLHSEMQMQLFGDDYDHSNKDQRMAAKIVNFGIPYGRTPGGVAKQLKCDILTAKRYLKRWFDAAPKVLDYIQLCHDRALADPQDVWVTDFGRSRRYFVTSDAIYHTRNQSVNFPISSTASDLTVHALIEIGDWLKENYKGRAFIVNNVHDSIIIECKPEDAEAISNYGCKVMAEIPHKYLKGLQVPFIAEPEVGTCWGDLKEPDWGGDDDDESDDD